MGTQKLQLSLRAEDLIPPDGEILSPYAVVRLVADGSIVGQTEVLRQTRSPRWCKKLFLEHDQESTNLQLSVELFTNMSSEGNGKDALHLGKVSFELGRIEGGNGIVQSEEILGGRVHLHVGVSCQGTSTGEFHFRLRGMQIRPAGKSKDEKPSPFFEIARLETDETNSNKSWWNDVYRSELVKENAHPYWETGEVDLEVLCNARLDHTLRVTLYDWKDGEDPAVIASFRTSVNDLLRHKVRFGNGDRSRAYKLVDNMKRAKGLITVVEAEVKTCS